jgi:uncharacterized membrane protein YkgB
MRAENTTTEPSSLVRPSLVLRRVDLIGTAGLETLRYGLVLLLLLCGSFKFFAFEAAAIRPLSPASPVNGFLLEDVLLLGAALFTAAEALRAERGGTA